ncbi:putative serine/threonine protein kinase [Blattamonas nauphoetae]|uniref:non-specific serine/threonine protein kinase n=1 Tax=Blattamonas nauphoetae TaxID=2049346 RepID=A0ABQ9WQQ9_9EUKA|nr:putative serine/threonine protein kinase [Blattamonas nauphoetae]
MTSILEDVNPPGYTNAKRISEGAFGQVLKVTHERSGVEYAVKVLSMMKEGDKERVSREVEMLTRFAHARIVGLHESIDMGGHHAIVMELGSRSLKDLISEYENRGELIPLPLTVMILDDICEGLLWMHTHSSGSAAHGNLKPENVLLRPNNRAFLCGIGGSAALNLQISFLAEMGTFEYYSPDRVMDSKGTATPASDVWSLGVLAYRMVTGRALFEGMTFPQLCLTLGQFNESRIPTTVPSQIRAVLLKMLEPNVALRATTTALFEDGLLERMLGPETPLSKVKDIQLATQVNELKELSSDVKVKKRRTRKLEMTKEKLLKETKELEHQLRLLQTSLHLTSERNAELKKEEELERRHHLLTTHPSPVSINAKDNVLSRDFQVPSLQVHQSENQTKFGTDHFSVYDNKITRIGSEEEQSWLTTLFEEPISKGVVSVAITVLAMPKAEDSEEGLMFGLVGALFRGIDRNEQLGRFMSSSIALAPKTGTLHTTLPSTKQFEKKIPISPPLKEGDRVVLEVDMDARPRTAVFIINGHIPLTFVSGLPPSIRFGLSMKNEGVSVQFDGMSLLKRATPLRRVIEIKWHPEDLRDSEDMFMNGLRCNVLTTQTKMSSLIFTDPSRFRVEDNRIGYSDLTTEQMYQDCDSNFRSVLISEPFSEGIVAISFTSLISNVLLHSFFFGVIDAHEPIPEKGQALGSIKNSIALSSDGHLHFSTTDGKKDLKMSSEFNSGEPVVVELNMDSVPRTAQFFINGKPAPVVIIGLPKSVRVGFSAKSGAMQVRFDRITHLNRASPITDLMKVVEWPAAEPIQEADVERKKAQFSTMKLPGLLFTNRAHFSVQRNVLTRTEKGTGDDGRTQPSTVLLSEKITKGVVSVTFVVLKLAESMKQKGFVSFGLLDSSHAVHQLGLTLGKDVQHSVAISSSSGDIKMFNSIKLKELLDLSISTSNRYVMEVNMDSIPRTVQFFKNGKAGTCYVSGIPESVRIGFSADVMGTSLQITSIIHCTQPTPLADNVKEMKWTDTEQSLKERIQNRNEPIRRAAKGSMPALLSRNPEHFKIEGNVITRTAFDCTGLTSPFSTVMLEGVVEKTFKSVRITILALPQTESSSGVVMFGCLDEERHIPRSQQGLGLGMNNSFALCSYDGMVHCSRDWSTSSMPSHSPLRVGDQVVLEVDTRSEPDISRFLVNGKAGESFIATSHSTQMIGVCPF